MSGLDDAADGFGAFSPPPSPGHPPRTDDATASQLARLASLLSGRDAPAVSDAGPGTATQLEHDGDWFVAEAREILGDGWGGAEGAAAAGGADAGGAVPIAPPEALWAVLANADRRARAAEVCDGCISEPSLSISDIEILLFCVRFSNPDPHRGELTRR